MGFGSLGSSQLPTSAAQAVKSLENELNENMAHEGNPDVIGVGGDNKSSEDDQGFTIAPTEEEMAVAAAAAEVENVMKENLDYGDSDINKQSRENIFEVLSNRYQKSGLKRLFNE
jgi:hypothetical protein